MNEHSRLERAILLALLSVEEGQVCTRSQLARELDIAEPEVERAVRKLHRDGLVDVAGERISASRAIRHLDALGLIGL